jgi:3-oxoadipate enol-lactonase
MLRFDTTLTHHGRTSYSLNQTARRHVDGGIVAEADFVFVCVDRMNNPVRVPEQIRTFFGTRPSIRAGALQHLVIRAVTTAVDVQGDGPGVLFVHGFPLDRTVWRHLIAPLTGWRRVAPDLRGMGLSDVPADGLYTMGEYADDLVALLDMLALEQVVVCGLSMGGYVAFELLRRHPQRIRALILANTRAEADSAEGKASRDQMLELVDQLGTAPLADQLVPKLLAPSSQSAMPQVVEHLRTMITSSPADGIKGALRAMRERPDSTDLLGEIGVPTLVVAGSEDKVVPVDRSRAMADAIPGAQFTVIPEAGHLTPLEQPIPTSRVILEFLESIG